MRFSVLIATLGRPDELRGTLQSLAACDPAPDEVIVIDADSQESARAVAEQYGAKYVRGPLGLTRQRNAGLEAAQGDVVVFLDDDVRVDRELFSALAEAYADRGVVGATGRIIEPDVERVWGPGSPARLLLGREQGTFTRFGYPRYIRDGSTPQDVEYMPGCFMSARRQIARDVGFDERLSGSPATALAEDEDFSYRLSRRGRIRYLPEVAVEHLKLGFGSRDERDHGRLIVVSRAYLFRKNFRRTPLARAQFGLLVLALVMHRVVNREWRGARGVLEGAVQAWRQRR